MSKFFSRSCRHTSIVTLSILLLSGTVAFAQRYQRTDLTADKVGTFPCHRILLLDLGQWHRTLHTLRQHGCDWSTRRNHPSPEGRHSPICSHRYRFQLHRGL